TPTDFEGVFNSPVILEGNQVLRVQVTVLLASGTSGSASAKLDNIGFVGTVVPEPASIAIFGLLGAGVAARRMRRK
ncbi:MAG: PEP-CTERM sorting domain-containing protein, partial [Pirellula sp.]